MTDLWGLCLLCYCFAVDDDSSAVGAFGVEAFGSGFTIVQIAAVLQDADIGIDIVPQLMAQGRAEILHDEFITCLEIAAAAAAFGDGEFHFHKIPRKKRPDGTIRAFGVLIRRCPGPA